MSPPSYSGSAWCCPALTLLCCRRGPMGAGLSQTQDGAVLASQHAAQPATMAEVVRERKRKMNGGLATLRRRLLAGRRGGRGSRNSRSTDRAAPLRDLLKEWSPLEVGALLEEYEALAALRDLCVQAELARPPAAALRGDLATLYDQKICPDAELIFKGACFPVHRAILSARCPYFRDLLNGYPSLGARVCLEAPLPPAVDAACLDGLLRYLYAGEPAASPCPACDGDAYETTNRRPPASSVPDCCPAQADSNRSQHGIGGRLALDVVGGVGNNSCTRRPDPLLLRRLASDLGATPSALHRDMRHLLDTAELADASLVFPGESYTASSWPASHTNTTNSTSSGGGNNDSRNQHPSSAGNQQQYNNQSVYGSANVSGGTQRQSNLSSGASPPSEEYGFRPRLELPCHRAVLGARSPFFRSVIQRRCRQQGNAQPNSDTLAASSATTGGSNQPASNNANGSSCVKIVLDEKVIPHKYARVLLHAVYTDQVDLNLIMRGGSSIFSCSLLANHGSSLGEAQALSGSRDQSGGNNRSGGGSGGNSGGGNVAVTHAPSPLEEAMELYEIGRFLELDILSQGCEDIIAERLSANSLAAVLKWSSQPHGSKWVHRQALRFLREEFQSVASGPALPQLEANHLAHALRCPFLQASELDALRAVIRWGEHRLVKRMEDREPNLLSHTAHSVTRKGVKKRDLSDLELRELLADILPLVRIDHILPPNNELLGQAIRRGLLSSPPSCMLGDEGGSHSSSRADAWIRGKGHGGLYVRPRLFMPYYEEVKALLEDQLVQETELVRMRRARYIPDIPDTLYMVSAEPRARSSASSSNGIPPHAHHNALDCSPTIDMDKCNDPDNLLMIMGHHSRNPMGQLASALGQAGEDGGTEAVLPPPGQQVVRAMLARERELRRAPACVRANGLPLSHTAEINRQIRLRVVREFNLPDSVADTLESAAALEAGNRSSSSACGDDDDEDDDAIHRRNNEQDRRVMMAPADNSEQHQSRSCMDGENGQRDANGSHRRNGHGSGDAIDSWCGGSPAGGRRPLPSLLTEGDANGQRSAESSAPRSRNRRQPHPGRGLSEAMPDVAMATNSLGRLRLGRDHVTVHGSTSSTSKGHYGTSTVDNNQQQKNLYGTNEQQKNLYAAAELQKNLYGAVEQQKNLYGAVDQQKNVYGAADQQKSLYGAGDAQKSIYGMSDPMKNMYGIPCEQPKAAYSSADHVKMVYGTASDPAKHVYDQSKNLYGGNGDHHTTAKNPYSHQLYGTCSRDSEFENVQCDENARLNDVSRSNVSSSGFNANSREICTFAMLGRDADKMYGSREMLCAVDRAHRPVIQKDGSCNSYSLNREENRQPPMSQREVCSSYSLNRDDHSFAGYRDHHQYARDINPYCLNKENLNQPQYSAQQMHPGQYCVKEDSRIAPVHQSAPQYCSAKDERQYEAVAAHQHHHPRQYCLPQKDERPSSYSLSRDVNMMQRDAVPYCLNKDERSAYSLNRDSTGYCLNKDDRLRHSAFMNPNQHLLQEGCTLGGIRNIRGDVRERRGVRYAADVVAFQRASEADGAQPLQLDLGDGNQHASPGRQSSGSQSPWNRTSDTRNSDRNPSARHSVQSDYGQQQQAAVPAQGQQNMAAGVYQAMPSSPSRGTYSRYISASQNVVASVAANTAQATTSAGSAQVQHNPLLGPSSSSAPFSNPAAMVSSVSASSGQNQMNPCSNNAAGAAQQSSGGGASLTQQQQGRQQRLNRLGQELAPPIAFATNGFSTLQHHGRSRSPRVAQPGHATLQRPRPIIPNADAAQSNMSAQTHANVQNISSSQYACDSLGSSCYGVAVPPNNSQRSSGVGEEDSNALGVNAVTAAVHRSHSAGSMASIHGGDGGKNNVQNVSGYNYAPAVVSSSYPSSHQTPQQHQFHEPGGAHNTSPRHFRSISSLSHEPFPYHSESPRGNIPLPALNYSNSSMENIIAENNRIVFTRAASYRSSPYQELPYSRVESPFSCVQRGDSPYQSRGGSPFRALDGTPTGQFSRGNSPYLTTQQGMQTRAQSPKVAVLTYSRNVTGSPNSLKVMSSSSRSQGGSPLSSFNVGNKQRNFPGGESTVKTKSKNDARSSAAQVKTSANVVNKSQNRNSAAVEAEQASSNARSTPSPSNTLSYNQPKPTPPRTECLNVPESRSSPSSNAQLKPHQSGKRAQDNFEASASRTSPSVPLKDDKCSGSGGRDAKAPVQNLRTSASQYHVGAPPRYL